MTLSSDDTASVEFGTSFSKTFASYWAFSQPTKCYFENYRVTITDKNGLTALFDVNTSSTVTTANTPAANALTYPFLITATSGSNKDPTISIATDEAKWTSASKLLYYGTYKVTIKGSLGSYNPAYVTTFTFTIVDTCGQANKDLTFKSGTGTDIVLDEYLSPVTDYYIDGSLRKQN